jgi:hypothetical protein
MGGADRSADDLSRRAAGSWGLRLSRRSRAQHSLAYMLREAIEPENKRRERRRPRARAPNETPLGARDYDNRGYDDGDCQDHARARAEAVEPSAHSEHKLLYGTWPQVPDGPISIFGLSRVIGGWFKRLRATKILKIGSPQVTLW